MALRHHVPEKSGTGLVGAPIAGKTRIAVEMNPAAARPKQFREMTPIPLLRIHEHAHSTALHASLRRVATGQDCRFHSRKMTSNLQKLSPKTFGTKPTPFPISQV